MTLSVVSGTPAIEARHVREGLALRQLPCQLTVIWPPLKPEVMYNPLFFSLHRRVRP